MKTERVENNMVWIENKVSNKFNLDYIPVERNIKIGNEGEKTFLAFIKKFDFQYKLDEKIGDVLQSQKYDLLVEGHTIDVKKRTYSGENPYMIIKIERTLKCDFYVCVDAKNNIVGYATKNEIKTWEKKTFGNYNILNYCKLLSELHPIEDLIKILLQSKELRLLYEKYGFNEQQINAKIRKRFYQNN